MVLRAMLIGGVLPGALAGAALGAAWWRRRRGMAAGDGPLWVFPVAVVLAMIPADLLVRGGLPRPWPAAGADRLLHAGAGVLVLALLEGLWRRRIAVALGLRVASGALVLWMILGVRIPAFWTAPQGAAWVGGLALLTAAVASAVERAARADRGPAVPAVLFVSVAGLPPVLLNGGMAHLAQLAGGVCAAVGAAVLVAALVPSFTAAGGGVTAVVTLGAGLLLAGHYYAPDGIALSQSVCLAVAPLGTLLLLIPRIAALGRWKRCALAAAAGAVPVVVGVALALARGAADGGYEYSVP